MAIRFVCPSCQQPLEIDDQWANQSVACPYCNRVVTAPAATTWSASQQVPVASPARSAFDPPPPPGGIMASKPPSVIPTWAVTMAFSSLACLLVSTITWLFGIAQVLAAKLGNKATRAEMERAYYEMLQNGTMPANPLTTGVAVFGMLCGILGLVLSIRTLMLGQRRGLGVFSCVLSILCVACQGILILSLLSVSMMRSHAG